MAGEFQEFKRFIGSFEHHDLDEAGVVSALADVRAVQRSLDVLVSRLSARADTLSAQGSCAPGVEMLRGDGVVSARQARAEARRAGVCSTFPGVGAAFGDGSTSSAHVDALGDLTRDLNDDELAGLDVSALTASACSVPVETFRRSLRRHIDQIRGDHGLGDAVAKQQAARVRLWRNDTTGMGHLSGELDPEAFEKLTNAVDQRMTELCSRTDEPVVRDEHLAAEALIDLITGEQSRNGRPSIIVVVDADTVTTGPHNESICQTECGAGLAPQVAKRWHQLIGAVQPAQAQVEWIALMAAHCGLVAVRYWRPTLMGTPRSSSVTRRMVASQASRETVSGAQPEFRLRRNVAAPHS